MSKHTVEAPRVLPSLPATRVPHVVLACKRVAQRPDPMKGSGDDDLRAETVSGRERAKKRWSFGPT